MFLKNPLSNFSLARKIKYFFISVFTTFSLTFILGLPVSLGQENPSYPPALAQNDHPLDEHRIKPPRVKAPEFKPAAPYEGTHNPPAYELGEQGIQIAAAGPDLDPTLDAPITPTIQALAQRFNYDPKALYLYVKNNVDYKPYYGSQKGAEATL